MTPGIAAAGKLLTRSATGRWRRQPRRLVRAARLVGERLAGGLGVGERLLGQRERAALHDRPLEQPARAARDQWTSTDTPPADWPAIVTLCGSPPNWAMLCRTQRSAAMLIHQAVVAGRATGPRGERRVGKEPERAEPVVDRDHDGAVCGELGAVVVAGAVLGEATAVNPHQHRPVSVAAQRRRVDVEVQAVLGEGPGGANGLAVCGQLGANWVASRTPVQAAGRCGGRQRRSPGRGSGIRQPEELRSPRKRPRREPRRPRCARPGRRGARSRGGGTSVDSRGACRRERKRCQGRAEAGEQRRAVSESFS